ncbi:phosphoglycerate kinase, cytosolic-like isoform X2 [Euphorbia lathyris]|uniref:phosphoglycerate kinase, cytosolic-like isoform X2 n=1 Tax=Euphorbia lathyris TaxID=212925 RepID=UPI0033140AF8
MSQPLNPTAAIALLNKSRFYGFPSITFKLLQPHKSPSYIGDTVKFRKYGAVSLDSKGSLLVVDQRKRSSQFKVCCDKEELETLPYVQTLREFPKKELAGKVVMVRFDSAILLEALDKSCEVVSNAIFTIKYLNENGAKIILVSGWRKKNKSKHLDAEAAAGILTSVLKHKVVALQCIRDELLKTEVLKKTYILLLENLSEFKEEVANSSKFAELLSSGVDIFVNDSFSLSHKILASTVAIARFCSARLAGFHFEQCLYQLKKTSTTDKKPYVAIIGGGSLYEKAFALHFLASKCDALFFVGTMSFQIMHAFGYSVPSTLVEPGAYKAAMDIIRFARERNVSILYPQDFWCIKDCKSNQLEVFPSHGISDGWLPVDLGPSSLDQIDSFLMKCKKVICIGPMGFKSSSPCINSACKFAQKLSRLSEQDCEVIIVGNMARKEVMKESSSSSMVYDRIDSASIVWEFFKRRKLPGIMALDRAYPFEIDWSSAFHDPTRPLVVDIGSGNGMFLLGMAQRRMDLNFLGLEMNKKLVRRCLDSVHQNGIYNGYFIMTNATTTFRTIVSSYPGDLVLVSIQCPNPDFSDPQHRWRMLQRPLIEAVADLLVHDGKIFLQSDIEVVAVRMKELFLTYSKGMLTLANDSEDDERAWLTENPFGVRSDWEKHVIDRGGPMYRLMLSKSTEC